MSNITRDTTKRWASSSTASKVVEVFNRTAHSEINVSEFGSPADKQARLQYALKDAVHAFQKYGHDVAEIDPLQLSIDNNMKPKGNYLQTVPKVVETLEDVLKRGGLTEADLDLKLETNVAIETMGGLLGKNSELKGKSLRECIRQLSAAYTGKLSLEFSHLRDADKIRFLADAMEGCNRVKYETPKKDLPKLLERVASAQAFESFLQAKAPTTKRFGVDGLESGISFLQTLTAASDADHCILGMAHRGRLNVLGSVFQKPMKALMREFKGVVGFGGTEYGNIGDVKYHLGVEHLKANELTGKNQRFSLLCNPSHLEAVDPCVLGRSKAAIDRLCLEEGYDLEKARSAVFPIMIHGDQALAGQGTIYEVFQMMNLDGYNVGGTVHIVMNNQIGFTTTNKEGCSSKYCTDIGKAFEVPILHCNADDLEAVEFAAKLAADYRQKFHSDIIIDIVGYRRNGHNEQDMPKFTQPGMYKKIDNRPPVFDLVSADWQSKGIVTAEQSKEMWSKATARLEKEYKEAEQGEFESHAYSPLWENMATPSDYRPAPKTGVALEQLKQILSKIAKIPDNITLHPNIKKIYDAKLKALKTGKGIDYGTAESLAFASLMKDGFHVRVAGQDSRRGTFSHRHATVFDQVDFQSYTPLQHLIDGKSQAFQVHNSLLSENAALGFEVGYANHHPDTLTIWEAQFGDFANGAQVVIDTMLCSQEVKWGQQSGLVMYLPHGYDGMGPEHSSARMERFLQLCDNREDAINPSYFDEDKARIVQCSNMQVIVPTTAANLYHALRRQMKRGFRKPMVVFQSKRLLKSKDAHSDMADMDVGTKFRPFIADEGTSDPNKVKRLVLCSGQVYFDLVKKRKQLKNEDVAIARVEQLCPLPFGEMKNELDRFPNLESVAWAQEESMNAGAWTYMNPRIQTLMKYCNKKNIQPLYIGRDICASTAVGCGKIHAAELQKLLEEAFDLSLKTHSPSEFYTVAGKKVSRGPSNPTGTHALQISKM